MTERLYYTDPYRTHFTARIVERLTWQGQPAVVLDRTAFYPTSGGQPADRGMLNGQQVVDVLERESDVAGRRAVVHVLSGNVPDDEVAGEIAWGRRFDHMQQHTGQHILSAAFDRLLDAETVGFHLGAESTTIDVDAADLEMNDVLPVEALANQVVWDDRRVDIRLVDRHDLPDIPEAALPDVDGPIRLMEIAGALEAEDTPFDVNPCGGTHVAHTGEIGIIKIVGLEHRGEETRVEFLCGGRALHDYESKRSMTARLGSMLTVGISELDEAVERLQEENKQLQRARRDLREQLLDMESTQLAAEAVRSGPYRLVGTVWEGRSPDELRILARKLAEYQDVVALLFSVHDRVHFCFARHETLELDVNRLLQKACARLDGKGGGRPHVAQGSAPSADTNEVEAVLDELVDALDLKD